MKNVLRILLTQTAVSYRFIMNNRKAQLVVLSGLIISLTIVSTSSMLLDSYRYKFVEEFFVTDEYDEYSGDLKIELTPDPDYGETVWVQNHSHYQNLVTNSFNKMNYGSYLLKQHWFTNIEVRMRINTTGQTTYLRAVEEQLFTEMEAALEPGGQLPENNSEVILVMNENWYNITTGIQAEILGPSATFGGGIPKDITVVGIFNYSNELVTENIKQYLSFSDDPFEFEYDIPGGYLPFFILTYPQFAVDIIDHIKGGYDFMSITKIFGKVYLDFSQIEIYNLAKESTRLNAMIVELTDFTFQDELNYADVLDINDLLVSFDTYEQRVQLLQVLLLLIIIPVIAIALYLISYSFTLINRQKRETIGIIKTRGGSWQQITLFLVVELLLSTIIAIIGGLMFGYYLSSYLLRSVGFLDFTGVKLEVLLSSSLILNLTLFAIIFTLLLNVTRIISYCKMSILESSHPVEYSVPLWKRYYLDVISTIVGIGGYIILTNLSSIMGGAEDGLSNIRHMIFLFLGVPAPFLLFFGSILLISRFFPHLIEILARVMWKRRGKLGSFALRNIVRHKHTARRAVILMILAISYSIVSASLAFSIDETKRVGYFYETGADLSLNIDWLSNTTIDYLENNVSGISSISQTFSGYTPSAHGLHYYRFLFVDPQTYAGTAFFEEDKFKLSAPLSTLMDKIADNNTILLYNKNMDSLHKNIDDQIGYHFYNQTLRINNTEDYRNYSIAGTFGYWPQQYDFPGSPSNHIFAIGSLGLFYELLNHQYLAISDARWLIDLEPSADAKVVYLNVLSYTSLPMSTGIIQHQKYLESMDRRFALSVLNSALIVCIVVSIISAFMFAVFTYLERGKEIGVERALGMTRIQTGKTFVFEGLSIVIFGLSIGVVSGLFNTSFFLLVTQMGQIIPPIIVDFPWEFITRFCLMIFTASVFGTTILAYQTTRRDISRVLKVE